MNYLFQEKNKLRVTDFISEIIKSTWKTKQSDFEKLACIHVNQHDLLGFKLKISNMNQWRETILAVVYTMYNYVYIK